MLPSSVSSALAGLYTAFRGHPLKPTLEGCPHCVGEEAERHLHRAPLRELTAADLGQYASKAMSTWGDAEDYRHFLPRICELSLSEHSHLGLEPWLVGSKLALAGWQQWPDEERIAVRHFLDAVWDALLQEEPYGIRTAIAPAIPWPISSAIELIVEAREELDPFLRRWCPSEEPNPMAHLAWLVQENAAAGWRGGKLSVPELEDPSAEARLREWLLDADTLLAFEGAAQKHAAGRWSAELATAVKELHRVSVAGND